MSALAWPSAPVYWDWTLGETLTTDIPEYMQEIWMGEKVKVYVCNGVIDLQPSCLRRYNAPCKFTSSTEKRKEQTHAVADHG